MVKIILKWATHFFSPEIKHIVKGNWYRLTGKNKQLYTQRMEVCKTCKSKIFIRGIGFLCNECGCPLLSKLPVKEEICDLHKW